jgi:hypothetical protein
MILKTGWDPLKIMKSLSQLTNRLIFSDKIFGQPN